MKSLKIHRLYLLGLCTLALISISVSNCMYMLLQLNNRYIDIDKGYEYITIFYEFNPLELADAEETMQSFHSVLTELMESPYTFYELGSQPLEVENGVSSSYTENISGSNSVSSIQISENVEEDFDLQVDRGRMLMEDDFSISRNESIPVLLGAAYADICDVGDTFEGTYLFSNFSFEVVGIIQSGCKIELSTGVYDLDHYIVMPSFSFDYTPETSVEFVTQKIHNANRISGKIKIKPSEFEQASAYVEEILESGPANFSWTSSSDIRYLDGIGVNVYGLFLACLCFFLLVVTVIVLFCRHQFSKHKAGMWYGVKKWKLFLHALMLIILSEITSAIVLLCFTLPILGALYLSPWSLLTSGAFALADGIGIIHLSACQQETTPCGDSLGNAV